jgi:hypothetical protein
MNLEKLYKNYDHTEKMGRGIQFTIDYNGNWYFHNGPGAGPIRRTEIAGLFGGAGRGFMAGKGLMRDPDGRYWLKSPESRYEVEVEDVPFLATRYEVTPEGDIDLYTNFGEKVPLGPGHVLEIAAEPARGIEVFYVDVRNGLKARLAKPVYEDLVNAYLESEGGWHVLKSRGEVFRVAECEE